MDNELFLKELEKIGIVLNQRQLEQFERYHELLVEWNNMINLTAITKREEVFEKHFYDCLLSANVYQFDKQNICDIGAGAGFPSIPLKIVFPELKITIVDSLEKRIKFLNVLVSELALTDVRAYAARAEEFVEKGGSREKYDVVMARAVARLNILDELCLPLVKIDGTFIALKGKQGQEEYEEAKAGIVKLGGQLARLEEYHLTSDMSKRTFIVIDKKEKTPLKYPRNFSQIKKKPL